MELTPRELHGSSAALKAFGTTRTMQIFRRAGGVLIENTPSLATQQKRRSRFALFAFVECTEQTRRMGKSTTGGHHFLG